MNIPPKPYNISKRFGRLIVTVLILFFVVSTTFAHGPKGHDSVEFTAMQAVKKAIEMFDRLIAAGKLEEDWETGLQRIEMSERNTGKGKELVVKFTRAKNQPQAVYIFFTEKGDYNGSNFTGE
jgi:hypothetical protein